MFKRGKGKQRRSFSSALSEHDVAKTLLGEWTATGSSQHDGQSGFMLLPDGVEAFSIRADLTRRAEQTLDVQTYILEEGLTTRYLFQQMIEAADRGVRVRFLIDDLSGGKLQSTLAALDNHPDIEVRLFNPVPCGRRHSLSRMVFFALGLRRLHRRMHNKLWLVDGAVGITGGRNMGDDYFNADLESAFADLDILAAGGSVVPELSQSFDDYWNHSLARPVAWFEQSDHRALQGLRTRLAQQVEDELDKRLQYDELVNAYRNQPLDELLDRLCHAKGRAVWDEPDKLAAKGWPESCQLMGHQIGEEIQQVQSRLFAISGYFVPDHLNNIDLQCLTRRGVEVTVLTNTLEATDVPYVHGGYAPYRTSLIAEGMELYEYRCQPKNARNHLPRTHSASLHTKAIALDDNRVIVGGFNLDPRSVWWNSEIALIVESEELNSRLCELGTSLLAPQRSYHLSLDQHGLLWNGHDGKKEVSLRKEPGSRWRHFQAWLSHKLRLRVFM